MIEIANCGSISKAAKKLRISQPTLSKYLANLESKLEIKLFDRGSIPISLTEAGEKVVAAGRRILDAYTQLDCDFSKIKSKDNDAIRLGISPTRAHYILPRLVREFQKSNSSAKLVVKERTTSQLNAELARGEFDIVISLKSETTRDFEAVPLFSEKVMLAAPKKYEKAGAMRVLKECPFISVGAGLRMANVLAKILYEVGAKDPVIEVQSIDSVLSLVNDGFGAALAPSYIAHYATYDNIVLFDLPESLNKHLGSVVERDVCIFYRKNEELTDPGKDFILACKKLFE